MKKTFSWFRKTAFAEGISFLVLLFIAMPLKYFASMPRDILHQFKEQQLVIIEDDFRLFPFQYSDPDLAYGFEESFVDNINED